jgi:hypothetical protein
MMKSTGWAILTRWRIMHLSVFPGSHWAMWPLQKKAEELSALRKGDGHRPGTPGDGSDYRWSHPAINGNS